MLRLKDKVAVITGSTSGMGKSAAYLFAKEGAKVVVTGRRKEKGMKIVSDIKKRKGKAVFVKLDVLDEESVKKMVKGVVKGWGKIDILYNNAGVELQKSVKDTSEEEWERVININLRGMFFCIKHCLSHMKKGGSIINTASVAGLIGYPMLTAYCASKGGVIALTRQVAIEIAQKGIRCNTICPGPIDTPMVRRYIKLAPDKEAALKQLTSTVPLGRMGKPEEVANLALFLASDESSYITGAVIPIDGGTTAV